MTQCGRCNYRKSTFIMANMFHHLCFSKNHPTNSTHFSILSIAAEIEGTKNVFIVAEKCIMKTEREKLVVVGLMLLSSYTTTSVALKSSL